LKKIQNGEAGLLNPAQWTSYFRTAPAKAASKIHKSYEKIAIEFVKAL
jgi:hypothetical protein